MMRVGVLLAFVAFAATTSVNAEVRIQRDGGGVVGDYLAKYVKLRESGQRVVIDGPCLSACTLLLAVIPRQKICVTRRAALGFHAPRIKAGSGELKVSQAHTPLILALYPREVRQWIVRRGGLRESFIHLRGQQLAAMYPRCT